MLARRPTLAELRDRLTKDDWALLESLREAEAVIVGPVLAPASARPAAGCSLTLVAHSCVLVETPTTRLLVDPVFSVRYRTDIDRSDVLEGGIDAVAISHPHWDHFNPDSLALIDPAAQVIVPARVRRGSLVNIDVEGLCRELGFAHVAALQPWQRIEVGDIGFTALPYFGEGSGAEGVQDWMTYAIQAGGKLIVGMVDACADDFGRMDEVLAGVRRDMGPIDVLLSPCSSFHFTHRHFHCRPILLDERKLQFTGSAADTRRWAEIGGASAVVPYAEFFFDAGDPDTAQKGPGQEGSWEELRAMMPAQGGGRLVPLRPGESLVLG